MRLGVMGGLLGAIGVAVGALGAHALRGRLDPTMLGTFDTAVRYQLVHALAVVLAAERTRVEAKLAGIAGTLFVGGVLLFSGSLYVIALGGPSVVGPLTPLGGLVLISGWLVLAASYASART